MTHIEASNLSAPISHVTGGVSVSTVNMYGEYQVPISGLSIPRARFG